MRRKWEKLVALLMLVLLTVQPLALPLGAHPGHTAQAAGPNDVFLPIAMREHNPYPGYQGDYTFEGGVPAQAGSPKGQNQTTLIIYVRASDDATANLAALRTSEQAEFGNVSTFYTESAFGQLSFNYAHAPATGWYQLPRTYDDYMWTPADLAAATASGNATAIKQAQDGQNLVQDFMGFFTDSLQRAQTGGFDVRSYSQVVVVIIGPFHRGTSYRTTTFTLTDSANKSFQVAVPVVVVSTNTGWSRTAHEFGHAFGGFDDLYDAPNRGLGNWDLMDCTDCTNQTTGWNKDKAAAWFSGSQMKILTRPTGINRVDDTTILIPYETQSPPAGAVQSLRLDVGGGMHLYVENRQTLGGQTGSQLLPAQGIIISDADDNWVPTDPRKRILLYGGPLGPGAVFNDQNYGPLKITISAVLGQPQNLQVVTGWGPEPFYDLRIDPWTPPPWESPDIWIDSQANGWDVYEYTDGSGNPVRNGDRPQLSRDNRVYARVHNDGNVARSNVQVSILASTPPGIGDTGNWTLLDRVTIPSIPAGGTVVAPPVIWRPGVGTHSCLLARIDYQSGELNANNNQAQENVDDYNTTASSPWHPIYQSLQVSNPTDIHQVLRLEANNLPRGWKVWVSQRFIPLAPGETKLVQYKIDPGEAPGMERGASVDVNIVGWILDGDGDSRLGGITAAVHLTLASRLVVELRGIQEQMSLARLVSQPGEYGAYITAIPGRFGLPIALEVRDRDSDEYAQGVGYTDANGFVFIGFDRLQGDLQWRDGGRYVIRALLYGDNIVGAAVWEDYTFVVRP